MKNTSLCCFSWQISFFSPLSDIWNMIIWLPWKQGWCTKWSCQTKLLFDYTSHESCGPILTVLRLFVELWSSDVLRQHLCFHFQFHQLQRPIWRLSEAIVSLCMQIFQLFKLLLQVSSLHLAACVQAWLQWLFWNGIIAFTRMIKRWAVARLCVFDKLESVQQVLILNAKCTVVPFSWATGDKHYKRCLEVYLYAWTLTLEVATTIK